MVGGDMTCVARFYRRFVPLADKHYDDRFEELRQKGLIE